MKCEIISSNQIKEFNGVKSISLPAYSGQMEVLPGHAESFVKLKEGTIIIQTEKKISVSIQEGICYINNDTIIIVL
jgi:F0F1-type ATP synthase epsilon subunit